MNTRGDWKSLKLAVLEMEYGKQAEVWNEFVSSGKRRQEGIHNYLSSAHRCGEKPYGQSEQHSLRSR